MNRTADLGNHIAIQLKAGIDSLESASFDPLKGVAEARTSIKSARAVLRLLEGQNLVLQGLNDSLRICASDIGSIRDAQVQRSVPPPLSPSVRAVIADTRSELERVLGQFESALVGLHVPNSEMVHAAGATYRQARRRFLRALPDDDDSGLDDEALNQCRKSTQRLFLQLDALLGGHHTKRSTKLGRLGDLMGTHRDVTPMAAQAEGPSGSLEGTIAQLGADVLGPKPSAFRDWLSGKLSD